jgi:RNA polymerase sigma factor (sigma-70 family)
VRERSRFHLRQRRGLQREDHDARDGEDDALARSPAETPAPEDEAVFREQFQVLLDALDDEERQVLELRLEARSQQEIAEEMAISERTVRRILKRVEERFARSLA